MSVIKNRNLFFPIALIEAIVIIVLAYTLINRKQSSFNSTSDSSCAETICDQEKPKARVIGWNEEEVMLYVPRELTAINGEKFNAKINVVSAKIYAEQHSPKIPDKYCELSIYGPFHQNLTAEEIEENHGTPLFTIDSILANYTYELTNNGSLIIQVEPFKCLKEKLTMKLNLRKKDKDGQEWELVWRPFKGEESASSHDIPYYSASGGISDLDGRNAPFSVSGGISDLGGRNAPIKSN